MKPVLEKSDVIQHRLTIESQNIRKISQHFDKKNYLNSITRTVHCLQHISFKSEDFPVLHFKDLQTQIQKFRGTGCTTVPPTRLARSSYFAEIVFRDEFA
jgi:hypothetical protein